MHAVGHPWARHRALACFVVALASSCAARAASAAENPDASYGRIEGDLSAAAGIGATFGPSGPRAAADLRLRYLWTAGLYVTYEDGSLLGGASDPRRALATGIELRPLFLARWLQGLESGNGYLDLAIDSLGLELGLVLVEPAAGPSRSGGERSVATKPGLQAGIGLQLPLFPRATGPVIGIHGGARFSDAALAGQALDGPSDRAGYLLVTLAWQQVFGAHLADLGDLAPR